MKILIADKFSENHLDHLKKLGCDVTYNRLRQSRGTSPN